METLDLTKNHTLYGAQGQQQLVVQNGILFSMNGVRLPTNVEVLKKKGFAVTKELRELLVREQYRREADEKVSALRAELKRHEELAMSEMRSRLDRLDESDILGLDELEGLPDLLAGVEFAPPVEYESHDLGPMLPDLTGMAIRPGHFEDAPNEGSMGGAKVTRKGTVARNRG